MVHVECFDVLQTMRYLGTQIASLFELETTYNEAGD